MADYSKFRALEREEEDREARAAAERRAASKARAEKEQKERHAAWIAAHPGEDPHEHSSCGCGYADPEALRKAEARRKASGGDMPIEERNVKKMAAIDATREHGRILFGEGKFEHALAVYERGLLIIHGCYSLTHEQERHAAELELLHHLNVAACQLRLGEHAKAAQACRQALALDAASPKAHYRLGQAREGTGDLEGAAESFAEAARHGGGEPARRAEQRALAKVREAERKARQTERRMAERLQGAFTS